MLIHQLLGVAPTTSHNDLRVAYRAALKQHHPDVSTADSRRGLVGELAAAWREYQLAVAGDDVEPLLYPVGPTTPLPDQGAHQDAIGSVHFHVSGSIDEVADSIYVVASWLGDPYHVDLPDSFDMILQDPCDAFCLVSFEALDGSVRVSLAVRSRLGPLAVDDVQIAQRFVDELTRLWSSE
jgi:hypothetical protein